MNYFWLLCDRDPSFANWVLYERDPDKPLTLRSRYRRFQCSKCKKVDELAAIKSGLDNNVVIRSRKDITRAYDDWIVVNQKAKAVLDSLAVTGVALLPLPDGKRYILLPKLRVQVVDMSSPSAMRVYGPECPACGRARERKGCPALKRLKLPKRGFDIRLLWPPLEHYRGHHQMFLVGRPIVDAIRKQGLKGPTFREAG